MGGIGRIMTRRQTWEWGEPTLEDLLSDPIVEAVLRRDGLTRRDVWRAVALARQQLENTPQVPSAAA